MKQAMKLGVLLPAAVLLVSGCATKNWVREQFTKSDAAADQRFTKVEGQVTKVEGQVEGVSTEVKGVTTQVKSLDGAVADARNRADAAMTKADGVDGRLTRLWSNRYNQKTADTLEVYFGFDKAELTDGAQTALLGVVKELQTNPTLIVELGGYTDPQGTVDYNYGLSQRRVEAVRRFLVEKGISLTRVHAVGLGPITAKDTPNEKRRRVTVKMLVDQE